jgi:hypothetical protein
MKSPINSTWHAFEMLAARYRIETEIENGGIEIDSECRETIVDALYVYVDAALLDLEEAEARIITAFLGQVTSGPMTAGSVPLRR